MIYSRKIGFETECLQLLNKTVGISSGLREAFGLISSMASTISASVNDMLKSRNGCCVGDKDGFSVF